MEAKELRLGDFISIDFTAKVVGMTEDKVMVEMEYGKFMDKKKDFAWIPLEKCYKLEEPAETQALEG